MNSYNAFDFRNAATAAIFSIVISAVSLLFVVGPVTVSPLA